MDLIHGGIDPHQEVLGQKNQEFSHVEGTAIVAGIGQ
jgi:hypothetical protein